MSDMIVVKSQIKELCRGMSISEDLAEALDKKVKGIVQDAIERAKANNRRTVMARDL